ncbi:MAG: heavy-metal-associated domain-containing protein [Aquincola tertiaricarbonis]
MISFEVNDMSCGHCVRAITQAVQQADPGAQVQVDLDAHRVQVQPVAADASVLRAAIEEAGYTPVAAA